MNRMMWLTTALGIIQLSQVARTYIPIRYVDVGENYAKYHDYFFDRIVALNLMGNETGMGTINAIGVHISSDRILTSFNPFRRIIRNKTMFFDLYAISLAARELNKRDWIWHYYLVYSHLACGRQIQDLPDEVITKGDLWHGPGNRNCPLHDLLVFRINNDLKVSTEDTKDYTPYDFSGDKYGIFLTELAEPNERIGDNFKFCAVFNGFNLIVIHYTEDDHALLDCDEWLPRDWGYFFCIRNKNKYKKVTSGAMLVSNEKLFGVASFVLSRGEESIIVFTDIRPYYDLIQNTCTYNDSEEVRPKRFLHYGYDLKRAVKRTTRAKCP